MTKFLVVLLLAGTAFGQTLSPAKPILVRVINCKNGRPLRSREVELRFFQQKGASNEGQRVYVRTDSKGAIAATVRPEVHPRLEVTLFENSNTFFPSEVASEDVIRDGVAINRCFQGAHVPLLARPGEISLYYRPLTFMQKIMMHVWE